MENKENNAVGGHQSIEASTSVTTTAIVGAPSIDESRPEIFKLNVDCFELVFEWLSLKDLLAFRRTCKRMKAVVDYYIKLNYPRVTRNKRDLLSFSAVKLECFEWIKHLKLFGELTDTQITRFEYVLNQLESLALYNVQIDGDLYEKLLKYFPRLKYLSVHTNTKTIIGTGNEWLQREYPTLEHFEIMFSPPLHREPPQPCSEILTFFERNPNVRMFSTNYILLSVYRDSFLGSNVKLDRLFINICDNLESICNLTNDLHGQGFYKELHLEVFRPDDERDLQHLWSFHNLEKLTCRCLLSDLVPPIVESTKEVSFEKFWFPLSNTPMFMATSLVNLTRVNLQVARLREIQLFVSHAPKLTQIRIYRYLSGATENPVDDMDVDEFLALNADRENLAGACKLAIYLDEKIFLKLKCTATVKFSMIELKRINSCEIEHISIEE